MTDKTRRWALMFVDRTTAVYFDSLGIEYILQEVLPKVKDKCIMLNIFRIQSDDSILFEFSCIAFIEHMIAGKRFLDYSNLFSSND